MPVQNTVTGVGDSAPVRDTLGQKCGTQNESALTMEELNQVERAQMARTQVTAAIWSICQHLAQKDQLTPQIASKLFSLGQSKERGSYSYQSF